MFRLTVIITGLLWASLLLISWSGPVESSSNSTQADTMFLASQP
jgi:hypothetical protein